MTREEAVRVLDAMIFGAYPDDDITIEKIEIEAVRFAIAALRGHQPDPDTGLVPCGGGVEPDLCSQCQGFNEPTDEEDAADD